MPMGPMLQLAPAGVVTDDDATELYIISMISLLKVKQSKVYGYSLCSPSSKIGSSPLKGCGGNCRPGGK